MMIEPRAMRTLNCVRRTVAGERHQQRAAIGGTFFCSTEIKVARFSAGDSISIYASVSICESGGAHWCSG